MKSILNQDIIGILESAKLSKQAVVDCKSISIGKIKKEAELKKYIKGLEYLLGISSGVVSIRLQLGYNKNYVRIHIVIHDGRKKAKLIKEPNFFVGSEFFKKTDFYKKKSFWSSNRCIFNIFENDEALQIEIIKPNNKKLFTHKTALSDLKIKISNL